MIRMVEKKKDPRGGNKLWEKFLAEAEGDVQKARVLQHKFWREVQLVNSMSHAECSHEKTRAARQKCRRDRAFQAELLAHDAVAE